MNSIFIDTIIIRRIIKANNLAKIPKIYICSSFKCVYMLFLKIPKVLSFYLRESEAGEGLHYDYVTYKSE